MGKVYPLTLLAYLFILFLLAVGVVSDILS